MDKVYLGDGAYCEYDGYAFILTTENGISVQNTVVLEPDHMNELFKFVEKMKNSREKKDL